MIVTYLNTWKNDGDYSARIQLMKEQTFFIKPDVLFLQEVFSTENDEFNTAKSIADSFGLNYDLVEVVQPPINRTF